MFTPELLAYIKSELAAGQSKDSITIALRTSGWQDSDITAAWKQLERKDSKPQRKPVSKKLLVSIVTLIIVCIIIAIYFLFSQRNSSQTQGTNPEINQTNPLRSLLSSLQIPSTFYSSAEQGYSFFYPANWQVSTQGSLTSVVSPETAASEAYQQFQFGDVLVSTVAYSSNTVLNKDQKAEELATLFSVEKKATKVSYNGMSGFDSASETTQGNTYNIVLAGEKHMILIQFPNLTSAAELNDNHKLILDSIAEL